VIEMGIAIQNRAAIQAFSLLSLPDFSGVSGVVRALGGYFTRAVVVVKHPHFIAIFRAIFSVFFSSNFRVHFTPFTTTLITIFSVVPFPLPVVFAPRNRSRLGFFGVSLPPFTRIFTTEDSALFGISRAPFCRITSSYRAMIPVPLTRSFVVFFFVGNVMFMGVIRMLLMPFTATGILAKLAISPKAHSAFHPMKELRSRGLDFAAFRTALVSGGYCGILWHSHRSFEAVAHARSIRVLPGLLTSPAYYTSEAT